MDLPSSQVWGGDAADRIRNGNYLEVVTTFLSSVPEVENDWCRLLHVFSENIPEERREEEILCLGIAVLALFIQDHWTGPPLKIETINELEKLRNGQSNEAILQKLVVEDGDVTFIEHPLPLVFAQNVFQFSKELGNDTTITNFWQMRGYFLQQLVQEEISPVLYEKIIGCIQKFCEEFATTVCCRLEKARIFGYYKALEQAQKEMDVAQEDMKFSYVLTGVLGKRTKFQQHDVAQLLCFTKSSSSLESLELHSSANVPFRDDLRLEHMQPSDASVLANEAALSATEYVFLLASAIVRRLSLPNHETHNEENRSIIERLFRAKGPWAATLSAHLTRLELEQETARRLIEAEKKIEWTLQEIEKGESTAKERLDCFFLSYLPSIQELKTKLAVFYYHCGDYKTALAFYENMQKWKMVINCLMKLNESHRAELIIRKQLETQPENITLWCYLGDVTDEPKHYEHAVELSGNKSAVARRHWGLYFYKTRKFEECIEHLRAALELNPFQPDIWRRLGWAAIETKNFELGAKCYKQYCMQENDDRDAWSNLAFCYSEMGEIQKGIIILKEALKVDMNFLKTWDSLAIMHTRLKQYDEAIAAYKHVLKINPSHIDPWVLKNLFIACNENNGPKKNTLVSLFKEIFQNRTKVDPILGIMYADLVKDTEEEFITLTELHTKASSMNHWESNSALQLFLLEIMERMLKYAKRNPSGKTLFNLLAKPAVAAVLAYDPDNTNYRTFQQKIGKELESA